MVARKQVSIAIQAQFTWAFYRDPTSGRWMATCDPVHITVSGDTETETKSAAENALDLLLTDLFECGELEDFLKTNGWKTAKPLPKPEARVKPRFRLPDFVFNKVRSAEELFAQA